MNWIAFLVVALAGFAGIAHRYWRDVQSETPSTSEKEELRRERIARSETRTAGHFCLYLAMILGGWMAYTITEAGAFAQWSAGTTILVVGQGATVYLLLRQMLRTYRSVYVSMPTRPTVWARHPENRGIAVVGLISAVVLPVFAPFVAVVLAYRRDVRAAWVVGLAALVIGVLLALSAG